MDVYAKAAKRFPRKFDIYLDLAEAVECVSPQQNVFVQQALASCLRRVVGKRYLAPDVRDLADGFSARLREIKLENPKPKRLPARTSGLPCKRESEVATTATALLVGKLMESRKRQEPQYEVAVQVVEGLGSWLDSCRMMARRDDRLYESGEGEDEPGDDDEYLDSDSDIRDSNDDASDEEDDEADFDGDGSSTEDEADGDGNEEEGDEPMDHFELDPGIVLQYGICQLFCGNKGKADNALSFLKGEEPSGPHGDMMMEVAKVRTTTFVDHLFAAIAERARSRNCEKLGQTHSTSRFLAFSIVFCGGLSDIPECVIGSSSNKIYAGCFQSVGTLKCWNGE